MTEMVTAPAFGAPGSIGRSGRSKSDAWIEAAPGLVLRRWPAPVNSQSLIVLSIFVPWQKLRVVLLGICIDIITQNLNQSIIERP